MGYGEHIKGTNFPLASFNVNPFIPNYVEIKFIKKYANRWIRPRTYTTMVKVKIKPSHDRPGQTLRVPGS